MHSGTAIATGRVPFLISGTVDHSKHQNINKQEHQRAHSRRGGSLTSLSPPPAHTTAQRGAECEVSPGPRRFLLPNPQSCLNTLENFACNSRLDFYPKSL